MKSEGARPKDMGREAEWSAGSNSLVAAAADSGHIGLVGGAAAGAEHCEHRRLAAQHRVRPSCLTGGAKDFSVRGIRN